MDREHGFPIILAFLLFFIIPPDRMTEADVIFDVENPEVNEVIFEGENVPMICAISDEISDVQFSIFSGSAALITNGTDSSGGTVTDITTTNSKIRFVVPTIAAGNSTERYRCEARDTGGGSQVAFLDLRVSEAGSVHCKENSSLVYLSMQSLELVCYFTSRGGDSFDWYKTDANGNSSVALASSLVRINNVKSRLVSLVEPSGELTPATFSCLSSTDLDTGCAAAMPYVIYSGSFIAFAPNDSVIQPGSEVNVTCRPVDIPKVTAVVFWNTINAVPDGVTVAKTDFDTLRITVDSTATLGSTISATCCMFIGGEDLASDFTITVEDEQGGGGDGGKGMSESAEGSSAVVVIVISVFGAALLVAVWLTFVCMFMMRNDDGSDLGTRGTRLSQIHGKVSKKTNRGSGADRTSMPANDYDVQTRTPAVAGNVVEHHSGDGEMGHYAGVRGRDCDPSTAYDRVNHGHIPDRGRGQDDPDYGDRLNDLEDPALYARPDKGANSEVTEL